jgi:hypothetical protein
MVDPSSLGSTVKFYQGFGECAPEAVAWRAFLLRRLGGTGRFLLKVFFL